jgi:hypothetical protein
LCTTIEPYFSQRAFCYVYGLIALAGVYIVVALRLLWSHYTVAFSIVDLKISASLGGVL